MFVLFSDSRDYLISLLLHAVIQPKVRTSVQSKENKKKRITIKEAKDNFVLHIKQICDFQTEIDKLKARCCEEKTTLQPLIIVVGENHLNLSEFYVYFDEVKFKLFNFVSSLDLCFKIFHVFNVKYPENCEGVWNFFQKYFFNYLDTDESIFPNVCGLVSYLKKVE